MQFPPQFVAVKLIPLADGKTDKIPLNNSGMPCDAHNPVNWMTEEVARSVPGANTVGFVFTDNDPYFFIDLDGAMGETDWHPWAKQICAAFPGAAMEISSSGKGLHIVGQCNKAALGRRKTRPFHGVEFYTTKRFMAFGHHGWIGDINAADWTATLAGWIPQKTEAEGDLVEGRDPAWSGPEDDEELIGIMLRSRPSIKAVYGQAATFSDLWTANVPVLSRIFPSTTDAFDRSRADSALMGHLAFYTGRDQARMDRIFRRSALMREKYEQRPAYRADTISGACQTTRNVMTRGGAAKSLHVANNEVTKGEIIGGSGIMYVPEMIEHFAGCVYVLRQNRILTPDGLLLDHPRFKAKYGRYFFQMSPDNTQPSKDAWEAFTQNRAVRFPQVEKTCFEPDMPFGALTPDGRAVNVYRANDRTYIPGDPAPYLGLLRTLFPDERDAEIILSYSAWVLQNQGRKARWAPVLCGPPGCGKTTLVECVMHGFREEYVIEPPPDTLLNNFNADLENALFANIEEINVADKTDILERLKQYITGTRMRVEPKGIDAYKSGNRINFWFNSNHKTAVPKDENDRRYAVFWTKYWSRQELDAVGLTGKYFVNLRAWMENGGLDAVVSYLLQYDIPDEFNPDIGAPNAPKTSITSAVISATRPRVEQEIFESVAAQLPGFRGGWVSTEAVRKRIKEQGLRNIGPARIKAILEEMRYIDCGHTSRRLLSEGGIAVNIWKHPALTVTTDPTNAYCEAQEYLQDLPARWSR